MTFHASIKLRIFNGKGRCVVFFRGVVYDRYGLKISK